MSSYRIEADWLVEQVDYHTCGAGDHGQHEPGCGTIPIRKVDDLLKEASAVSQIKQGLDLIRSSLGDVTPEDRAWTPEPVVSAAQVWEQTEAEFRQVSTVMKASDPGSTHLTPELVVSAVHASIYNTLTNLDLGWEDTGHVQRVVDRIAKALDPELHATYGEIDRLANLVRRHARALHDIIAVVEGKDEDRHLADDMAMEGIKAIARCSLGEIPAAERELILRGHKSVRIDIFVAGQEIFTSPHMHLTLGMVMHSPGYLSQSRKVQEEIDRCWRNMFELASENPNMFDHPGGYRGRYDVRITWS